jgi:hypothetical protein
VSSGPSLCSIEKVSEVDLINSIHLGGKTLQHRKYSGNFAKTFLLAESSILAVLYKHFS